VNDWKGKSVNDLKNVCIKSLEISTFGYLILNSNFLFAAHSCFHFDIARPLSSSITIPIFQHSYPTNTKLFSEPTVENMVSFKIVSFLAMAGTAIALPGQVTEAKLAIRQAPAYMSIVNEYRTKLGLPTLAYDPELEANDRRTCVEGNGQLIHKLYSPTLAQVLAQGNMDQFKHIFVGGWLCERPNMPGLGNECATESQGWYYGGQTGHADILISTAYTRIGCASAGGVTGCDLR
jgi:hypothetical protein